MGLIKGVRRKGVLILTLIALTASSLIPLHAASAAPKCDPVKAKGKTIGSIKVDRVIMPIKNFMYPAGGIMEPQGTTLAAGLSQRHMPLNSTLGTSVITWHVNYNGCWNKLNVMMYKKVGTTFKVTDEDGTVTKYKITKKLTIKKGKYRKSWFQLIGPRQLALFTCTGAFKNGHYTQNMVFIATPVV